MSNLAGAGGPAREAVGLGGVPAADCRLCHGNQPGHIAWPMELWRQLIVRTISPFSTASKAGRDVRVGGGVAWNFFAV